MVPFTGYGPVEFFVNLPVAGINTAITDHFIMLFRDMRDSRPGGKAVSDQDNRSAERIQHG